jgi:hypothetical protein
MGFSDFVHRLGSKELEEDKKHDVSETGYVSVLRSLRYKGPNSVGVSPHLRTETDPVPETSCFLLFKSLESG